MNDFARVFVAGRLATLLTLVWSTIFATSSLAAETPKAPNLILIVSDDQGWNDIGYHNPKILTPHLDRLAATGVRLEANYVLPTCSPTRAALLTGINPSRYGIMGPIAGSSKLALPTSTITLARALKSRGYTTAITGKWHLGLRPEVGPRKYGFDRTYGYLHGQIDPYTHRYKLGDRTWHRQDKLFDEEGHATDLIAAEAVRIIERQGDGPLFLYVPFSVPHHPLAEPEEWTARYKGRIDDPSRRLFAASLTHMDAAIGRIVAALDRTKKRSNTLIVFTSDNGGQKSWGKNSQYEGRYKNGHPTLGDNRPLRGWKGGLYEGGIRVPALANWPGRLKPGKLSAVVSALDWYPTFAHLAGYQRPSDLPLEGQNIWPLLVDPAKANSKSKPRTLYWNTGGRSAVRRGPWKLLASGGKKKTYQLFNLDDDPHEKTDLSGRLEQQTFQLRGLLEREASKDFRLKINSEGR